jgi:hypothetical protein
MGEGMKGRNALVILVIAILFFSLWVFQVYGLIPAIAVIVIFTTVFSEALSGKDFHQKSQGITD